MEILLWLAPSAVLTLAAMAWVGWVGRPGRAERERGRDRSEAAYGRFAEAVMREHPGSVRQRPAVARDRSTGIAVRPSRGGAPGATGERTRRHSA